MGLISGMVMGVLVGVAVMAGWSRVMLRRSRKRVAKTADIKVLGSLGRDDLRKLCGDNFPEWISFPQFEQVKWLNKHLSKLWPFVAEAATAVVKESVEPLLDDYRPPGIKSLKFSKFSLGTVSPKIEGFLVYMFDIQFHLPHVYLLLWRIHFLPLKNSHNIYIFPICKRGKKWAICKTALVLKSNYMFAPVFSLPVA